MKTSHWSRLKIPQWELVIPPALPQQGLQNDKGYFEWWYQNIQQQVASYTYCNLTLLCLRMPCYPSNPTTWVCSMQNYGQPKLEQYWETKVSCNVTVQHRYCNSSRFHFNWEATSVAWVEGWNLTCSFCIYYRCDFSGQRHLVRRMVN